jgi:hypothetical protein
LQSNRNFVRNTNIDLYYLQLNEISGVAFGRSFLNLPHDGSTNDQEFEQVFIKIDIISMNDYSKTVQT